MKSALRRLRNAQSGPPVPVNTYGFRGGRSMDLGTGRQSLESQMRAYERSGTVYAIVSLLMSAAAYPEWHLYKKQPVDGRRRYTTGDQGSDQRTEVTVHPALSLWRKPNAFMSGFEFREGANQHFELTGETYWVVDRTAGIPTSMWYVNPARMEPIPSPEAYLVGWVYTAYNGEQVPLELDQVIQEKIPHPTDPYRGMSPIASLMPNIQQQHYATDYMRNVFLNGASPGGVIQVDGTLTDEQFDQLANRWREMHQGYTNAARVAVLENMAKWLPDTQSNKDLEYGNLRLNNRDEIREGYRMHKALLGTVEDVNRANAQTAEETFSSQLQIPRLDRRKETLNTKFLPLFGKGQEDVYEFDYDDPSPVNQENANAELLAKSQAAQALISSGLDPADVLEAVGLPAMGLAQVDLPDTASAIPTEGGVGTGIGNRAGDDMAERLRRILNDGYQPVETGRR